MELRKWIPGFEKRTSEDFKGNFFTAHFCPADLLNLVLKNKNAPLLRIVAYIALTVSYFHSTISRMG